MSVNRYAIIQSHRAEMPGSNKRERENMLRSNSKAVVEKIHKYIVDGIDHDYFGLDEAPDFPTACKLILTACEDEKRYNRIRSGLDTFRDWAQGLPTALNTCYYYNVSAVDLLADWLEETEAEKK